MSESVMTRDQLLERCKALAGVGDVQAAATLEVLGQLGRLESAARNSPLENTATDLAFRANAKYILDGLAEKLKLATQLGLTGGPVTAMVNVPGAEEPTGLGTTRHNRERYYEDVAMRVAAVVDRACAKSNRPRVGTPGNPSSELPNWIAEYIREYGESYRKLKYLIMLCEDAGINHDMPADWNPGETPKSKPVDGLIREENRKRMLALQEAVTAAGLTAKIDLDAKPLDPEATAKMFERLKSYQDSVAADPEVAAVAETRRRLGLPAEVDPGVVAVKPATAAGSYDKTEKNPAQGGGNKD